VTFLDCIRQALEAAVQLAAAMKYLHCDALPNCMVLHRDLKPENVSYTYIVCIHWTFNILTL
jgi:serine/threonine protein kinase